MRKWYLTSYLHDHLSLSDYFTQSRKIERERRTDLTHHMWHLDKGLDMMHLIEKPQAKHLIWCIRGIPCVLDSPNLIHISSLLALR